MMGNNNNAAPYKHFFDQSCEQCEDYSQKLDIRKFDGCSSDPDVSLERGHILEWYIKFKYTCLLGVGGVVTSAQGWLMFGCISE